MRASVASFTKKFISTFFAATLVFGLVPAAAFADDAAAPDDAAAVVSEEATAEGASPEAQDGSDASGQDVGASDGLDQSMDESQDGSAMDVLGPAEGEEPAENDAAASDDPQTAIPAVTERISETVSLTQPIAQQESTRSFFLAQTLESTKSVPIVSANLPLDTSTNKGPQAGADGGTTVGSEDEVTDGDPSGSLEDEGESEPEGGEDSDESDLDDALDMTNDAVGTASSEVGSMVSAESTVIGSFTCNGIVYALEPGGETVAAIAADLAKLPQGSIDARTIVLPSAVPCSVPGGIDLYTVSRIAEGAFASLGSDIVAVPSSDAEAAPLDEDVFSENENDGASDGGSDEASPAGISVLGVPAGVTRIEDAAFEGFDTLQHIVVEEGNPEYASYDGALYSADLTNLRLIPEGRVGAVRVAPSATAVDPEVFSHCPSVDAVVADPESAIYPILEEALADTPIGLQSALEGELGPTDPAYSLAFGEGGAVPGITIEGAISLESFDERMSAQALMNYLVHATTGGSLTRTYYYNYQHNPTTDTTTYPNVPHLGIPGTSMLYWSMYLGNPNIAVQIFSDALGSNVAYLMEGTLSTDPGYSFWGYSDTATSTSVVPAGTSLSGSTGGGKILYARWKKNGTYTVTLDKNATDAVAGTGSVYYWKDAGYVTSSASTTVVSPNSVLVSSLPTRTGYNFTGYWSASSGGTKYVDKEGKLTDKAPTLAAGTTWYAQWEKQVFRIKLDKNHDDATAGTTEIFEWYGKGWYSDIAANNAKYAITAPTRKGYKFRGYGTSTNTSTASYWTADTVSASNISNPSNTAFSSNKTLYAVWEKAVFTITLEKNATDASAGTTTMYLWHGTRWCSDKATNYPKGNITAPVRTGYKFKGYAKKDDADTAEFWTTDTLTASTVANPSLTAFDSDITLYAVWSQAIVTVKFDANSGAAEGGTDRIFLWHGKGWYEDGSLLTEKNSITVPKRTGYRFDGYATDPKATKGAYWVASSLDSARVANPANTTFKSDITLYAVWTKAVFTIEFHSDKDPGETVVWDPDHVYQWHGVGWYSDYECTKPINWIVAPVRSGYRFKGFKEGSNPGNATYWVTDTLSGDRIDNPINTTFSESKHLAAVWEKAVFGITLYKNADDAEDGTTKIYEWYGKGWYSNAGATNVADSITAPTRAGYKFKGYATRSTANVASYWTADTLTASIISNPSNTTFGSGTPLYAVWERAAYAITWKMQGHGTEPAKAGYIYGETYTLPAVANVTGWTFGGWYTDSACTTPAPNITSTTTGDKTFYAKWTRTPYKIEWKMQGHGTAPTKTGYTYGETYTLPMVADVTGYSFGGWYTNSACTTKASNITSTTTGDKTFYAKWTLNSHKVYWRYDGAEGKTDSEEIVSYGASFTMKEPGSKPGYSFAGWKATGADTNTYAQGVSFTMPDGDVTFTAQWSKSAYTKVNLADTRLQEGIGAVWHWPERGYVESESSIDVKGKGERIVAPPAVDGYEFLGWYDVQDQNENSDAHRMIDASGNLFTETAPSVTTTWWAHWKRVSCPVVLAAEYDSIPYVIEKGDEGIPYARFGEAFSSSAEGGRLKALPHRTGYTFMGYYTERNPKATTAEASEGAFKGTRWISSDGSLSDEAWNLYPTEERGSITLYAAWRLDDCKVSFDAVSDVAPNTEPVVVVNEAALAERVWNYGEPKGYLPVASSSTFSRNGYFFEGWYFEQDGERVFVSDAEGNPTPDKWMFERGSVVLRPAWTAKGYTLLFDPAYPDVAGMPSEGAEPTTVTVSYDDPLDLASLTPSFGAFSFAGWYDESERSFEGAHMTDGRFTPRGSLVAQDPIRLHARWNEPGRATYTLYVGTPDGTDLVSERPFEYRYTETIAFNGTEAPEAPEGYRFVGWVEVGSDAEARALIARGGPADDAVTTPGFGPLSSRNLFFVAKWATVPLSTTLRSTASEDGSSWLLPTDRLVDFEREGAIPWSGACEAAGVSRPELARKLSYDVAMEPFALPDVVRKGHVFAGWRKAGSSDAPERGIVVDPSRQIGSVDSRDLVYAPVFEEAYYTIVLDGNGYGEDARFEDVAYGDSFSFPYPATLQTGSCFAAWASAPTTASSATETFFPDDEVPLAPSYDETGQIEGFGLAQLADEDNVITLYAVWNAPLSVEVPLFANMAVGTESGDVIAGANALRPIDQTARYRVESIRCEPVVAEGHAPFEGIDGVYLSVYAGLSLPADDGAERDLLRASNVGEGGEVSYTDPSGASRTARPLLIALGGEAASLWTRTAPEGSPSLESVTDADVPCGFLPFDSASPLTVRYGIWAEDADLLRAHAHGSGAAWTLPENDGANEATSDDPRDPSYGKREGWSSESVPVARLRYTVGLL